jgi:hypothetical protein
MAINDNKPKHMVASRNQNAGQSHNVKIGNKLFGSLEQFENFGTNLFGPKRGEITWQWRKLRNEKFNDLYISPG